MVLTSGTKVPFDLCCWAAGPEPHDVCANLGLELSSEFRFLIPNTCRCKRLHSSDNHSANQDRPNDLCFR